MFVSELLQLGPNAKLRVKNPDGTTSEISINELLELDGATKYVELTAASTLTAADSGKVYLLNSATEFATTLPLPAIGLNFEFIVKAAPASASYTVLTSASANIIHGVVTTGEDAAGSVATAAAADTITFVDAKAIIGDRVKVESDGTNWYITGFCAVQDGITTTQAT